ncbi:MAG: RNA methyltransferase [Bacilli bacterium]|nr:RNA methyltransferase [Bacilli bacterium]
MINSLNNERVKRWTSLNDKKYQEQEGLFLIEGEHLVEEAFKSGHLVETIVLDGCNYDYENVSYVSEAVMKKITNLTNVPKIIGVSKKIQPKDFNGNMVILDRVADPGNLGTIIRSAVAFGIDTIVLGKGSVNVYNPKVVRATEGLLFHINIIEADLEEFIPKIKENGYKIFVTDVLNGNSLYEEKFDGLCAIVMGNEGVGVNEDIKALRDEALYIPIDKTCESLNVGVATSIILYEMARGLKN